MRPEWTGFTRGLGAIAVIGAAATLWGCSTSKAIWPGDLPIVTAAAARQQDEGVTVHSAGGYPVELDGRLDAVVVTRSGQEEAKDRYAAPLSARIDGTSMVVASEGKERRYEPGDIRSVRVLRYHTTGAVITGATLTALGVVSIVLGAIAVGRYIHETEGIDILAAIYGIPLLSGGLGFAAGGVPLIVAGARDPWASRPQLRAGPVGLNIAF